MSEPCRVCNGNDRDVPCAYPSGDQPGCLRDARLRAEITEEYRTFLEYMKVERYGSE